MSFLNFENDKLKMLILGQNFSGICGLMAPNSLAFHIKDKNLGAIKEAYIKSRGIKVHFDF